MADDAHRARGTVWITTGLAALSAAWYAQAEPVGAGAAAIGYAVAALSGIIACVAVHRLRPAVPLHPAGRRFWLGLLIAIGSVSIGYLVLAAEIGGRASGASPPAMAIPAAVAVTFGFGIAMLAVAQVPAAARGRAERWQIHLDRTIASLGCATALWYFAVLPMLTAPAGDLGGVPAHALLVPVAAVLIALGVRARTHLRGPPGDLPNRLHAVLPSVAIGAVSGALLAVAFGRPHWPVRSVVLAAVAVTALVAVRQLLAYQGYARLARDVRAKDDRLHYAATHDGLTGLANRALFRERLAAALRQDSGATVLVLELGGCETVNESLGQDVGDGLLGSVAVAIRAAVQNDGLPARTGRDEFAVLLAGAAPAGETVAERLLDALSRPIGEHRLMVQASVGIATAAADTSPDGVVHHACAAMHAAKQRGNAGYIRYLPGMEEPARAQIELGRDLRRALDAGEFRLVYQPIIGLDAGQVIGVEALVRWDHPTRGTIPPGDFVPVAERTGLIVPLGRYVLREACRQAATWIAEFGPDALQKIAPNVSARQLHEPDFVAEVAAALSDSGLSCDRLVLELTESAVLRGSQISRTLHELDRMGIKLALDDFGTGESSLSLLRSIPVAIIKLDKSFVDGIEIDDSCLATRDARQAVARAVIQLAGALGLDAVAEGIENAAQVDRLREFGYSLGQGFHLARPMSAEDMSQLLAAQRSVLSTAA
ncbi:MAG TPA: bifunctional diguanylate cyclase/phosphodiesterase [Micromonosporaceae bacterium]|nr:bifunctional diguanylate cyclase/phosphodiesterase [Micromonosporaceae bacterium]